MPRQLSAAFPLAGALLSAAPAMAEALTEHTLLITWAAEHCEGFSYAEDLLMHANLAVFDAPEAEVTALREKTEADLAQLHQGDLPRYCETVNARINTPAED